MMKSKDLILRKDELQAKKKDILHQIGELTANMERKSLEDFIKTGNAEQVDGHRLELLQRKHKHLINLEGSLSLEIGRLRKKERTTKLQKLERKVQELEKQRKGPLYQKYLHFQSKIQALREQDKELKAEATAVKSQTFQFHREVRELHFRLPGLEKFLKENYVAKPEELEKLTEEAYKDNQKVLNPGPQDKGAELIRGYGVTLNRDTGAVTKIEPLTCGMSLIRINPKIRQEVEK